MKHLILTLALLTCSLLALAQKGISYQAVILDPKPIEIPGQDVTGQPFVNGDVSLKFKIFSSTFVQEFEEVHVAKTDGYGLVNVLIGSVSPAAFSSLVWDSNPKNLQVWVSFDQGGTYTKVSEQVLTYNPYAIYAETAGKLGGTLGIAAGGTGATTVAGARANLGLGNVDNTADVNKPVSTATQLALDAKVNELTTYVNNQVAAATIADADATTKGKIQLAGDLAGTAAAPSVPGLAVKADAAAVAASLGLKEDVSNKANTPLGSSTTLFPTQNAVKAYVDAQVAGATIADANGSTKGKIQLAGDLGGTAAAPTVPGLALKLDANQKGVANGVATLNSSGIIPSSQIPPVTVSSTTVVGSDAAMTALSNATVGSIAVRTDVNRNYVLSALPASTLGNWIELLTPGAPVQTVNGYTGSVNLSKTDLGLGEVNNTSDLNKPISTATQNALDLKANGSAVDAALATKLSTADATAALALKLDANKVAVVNGVASLDASGKVPTDQIPAISFSSVKVLGSENEMLALSSAVIGSVVIRTDVNKNYVLAASNPAVLANWIELLTPAPPVQTVNGYSGNVSITKADLGLGNVQNTSDADKVISTRTQTALDTKVDKVTGKSLSTNDYSTAEKNKLAAITGTNTGDQDLSAYVTTAGLNTKVDKETGKGLSTNDYSTAEKTKLAAITGTNTGDQDLSAYATNTNLALKSPLASPSFTGTVAIGTTNPSPSAVLDVTSTSKGLLLPRLTFAQKSAIVSPEPGLIFWCTDCGTSGEMQVYNGTAYVNMIGSPAQLGMPAIGTTTGMSSITSSTASSGGVISSDGGAAITARGVVWGTSTNPTIALSTKTTDGTGTGTFTSSLTGLTSGVTYYVRSYATNSVGTKYGSEITFNSLQSAPTLAATTAASSIGATTATSGGTISYNGGATVTVSGLVWSTSTAPTIALSTKTTNGTLTGTYTSAISGLTPGTLYYVRSYATNAVGTSYGAQTSFTTLTTPTLAATTAASSITSTTATSGGNISSDGGSTVTGRGIVWGTATSPTTALSTKTTTGTGTGTYTSNLTGLSPATTYYVRSYATNAIGTSYGAEISFTTLAVAPTLATTTAASSITGTTATSGGNVSADGGAAVTARGIVWGIATNPTTLLTTKTTDGTGTGVFTSSLTGLSPATLYYVRSYATNAIGTSYGAEISFTTLAVAPTLAATTAASSITGTTATSAGTISTDGGSSVTAKGVVWGTATNPTTALSTKTTDGTGSGAFTSSLTGLTAATTYYVRSYATNAIGTSYGTEISFTTLAVAPTLSTTAASSITKYAATSGGTITTNGGSVITASGICWSTSATPTISDSKTTDGTTTGTFTSSITGLTAGTTYYVRAYATNAIGTSYGAAQSFTTLSPPPVQTAVLIGTQVWTDKNLNVATYRNGEPITYAADAAQWAAANSRGEGAYTYLKFASGDAGARYGKLYNWYAVSDARGLAPTGYHIPTLSEWTTLRNTQPLNGTTLKSNTSDWSGTFSNVNNNITVASDANYSNYNGTNSTGFNALPGGSVFNTGTNGNYGSASFWTATPDGSNPLRAEWMYFHPTFFYIGSVCCATENIQTGMSVRLVKDNTTIETASTTPTLAATTTATSITTTTAVLGGNVTDEGATQVSARGLVYGTTTGSSTFNVAVGSGAGTFTGTLTGLAQGTTYYVRSFATNAQGTSYGAETSFTTQTTPTVSVTATPTSITTTAAIGGGTISSTGGATITTSGLVWGASTNPEITLTTKTTDGATSGTFTSSITGLTQGTTYHVRAYATNSVGTSYGPNITFNTLTTPTVSATATVTSITGTTATSGGTISSDGGATITSKGVVYGTSSGSSTYSSTSGTGTAAYVSSLTGLSIATTYYVRAFATNSVGTSYGPEVSFTTASAPTISSTTSGTITSSSAILGGVLGSTGGATTSFGVIYSTSSSFASPTTATINSNASAGTYTTSITGLSATTTYYVKAFATNTVGTTYGPTINFTTPVAPVAVGDLYGGGIVFYILQPLDNGYDANVQHGLIAQPQNEKPYGESNGATWTRVALNGNTISGAQNDGTLVGRANTAAIIANQGDGTYLFKYVSTLTINGYTDWYVPSIKELYLFRAFIFNPTYCTGGSGRFYWMSKTDSNYKWSWGDYISSTQNGSLYQKNYVEGNGVSTTTYSSTQTSTNFVYVAIRSF